ncbi:MAG: hypothetical protein MHM6MM_004080 [Cercozoa sp. M6MM]
MQLRIDPEASRERRVASESRDEDTDAEDSELTREFVRPTVATRLSVKKKKDLPPGIQLRLRKRRELRQQRVRQSMDLMAEMGSKQLRSLQLDTSAALQQTPRQKKPSTPLVLRMLKSHPVPPLPSSPGRQLAPPSPSVVAPPPPLTPSPSVAPSVAPSSVARSSVARSSVSVAPSSVAPSMTPQSSVGSSSSDYDEDKYHFGCLSHQFALTCQYTRRDVKLADIMTGFFDEYASLSGMYADAVGKLVARTTSQLTQLYEARPFVEASLLNDEAEEAAHGGSPSPTHKGRLRGPSPALLQMNDFWESSLVALRIIEHISQSYKTLGGTLSHTVHEHGNTQGEHGAALVPNQQRSKATVRSLIAEAERKRKKATQALAKLFPKQTREMRRRFLLAAADAQRQLRQRDDKDEAGGSLLDAAERADRDAVHALRKFYAQQPARLRRRAREAVQKYERSLEALRRAEKSHQLTTLDRLRRLQSHDELHLRGLHSALNAFVSAHREQGDEVQRLLESLSTLTGDLDARRDMRAFVVSVIEAHGSAPEFVPTPHGLSFTSQHLRELSLGEEEFERQLDSSERMLCNTLTALPSCADLTEEQIRELVRDVPPPELDQVLQDKDLCAGFSLFLARSLCSENLTAYEKMIAFEQDDHRNWEEWLVVGAPTKSMQVSGGMPVNTTIDDATELTSLVFGDSAGDSGDSKTTNERQPRRSIFGRLQRDKDSGDRDRDSGANKSNRSLPSAWTQKAPSRSESMVALPTLTQLRVRFANHIWQVHLSEEAPHCVNLPYQVVQDVRAALDTYEGKHTDLFRDCKAELYDLMRRDSLRRFLESREYVNALSTRMLTTTGNTSSASESP